ncbi:MAG: alpha/beta hydrolase [Candidatus Omnitrophota bacterium]
MIKNIVFLPGWSFSAGIWERQKDYFSRLGFNIILCQLEDLGECLKAIELEETIFIAWSLGWFRLLDILKDKKSLPQAIVGISAAIKFKNSLIRLIIQSFKKNHKKLLTDFDSWLFSERENKSANFNKWNELILRYKIKARDSLLEDLLFLENIDLTPYLHRFNTPILFIAGKEDIICPLDESVKLSNALSKSKIEIMDTGHIPFLTKSGEFNKIVERYIRKVSDDS